MAVKRNTQKTVSFPMYDSSDPTKRKTGLTVTVTVSKDGAASAASTNAASEVGSGIYKIALTATEMDADTIVLIATATGACEQTVLIETDPVLVNSNLTQIDGQATNGNNATLRLKMLDVQNSNGHAVYLQGTGGAALRAYQGNTGAMVDIAAQTGIGLRSLAANGQAGISTEGNGAGHGLQAIAGATGHGIRAVGGATVGDGISAAGNTDGSGIVAAGSANRDGLRLAGSGSGVGLRATGGATGDGMYSTGGSTSGNGLRGVGTGGLAGMHVSGQGNGPGLDASGGGGSSHGIRATGSGVGSGLNLTGGGTGDDLKLVNSKTNLFNALTSAMTTAGSVGKLIVDKFNEITGKTNYLPDSTVASSAQMQSIQNVVEGISNVTRLSTTLPSYISVPEETKFIGIEVAFKDVNGLMADPDNMALSIQMSAADMTPTYDTYLYKDPFGNDQLTLDPVTGFRMLERNSVGYYFCYLKVEPSFTDEEVNVVFAWTEDGNIVYEMRGTQVANFNGELGEIFQKASDAASAATTAAGNAWGAWQSADLAARPEDVQLTVNPTPVTVEPTLTEEEHVQLMSIPLEVSVDNVQDIRDAVWSAVTRTLTNEEMDHTEIAEVVVDRLMQILSQGTAMSIGPGIGSVRHEDALTTISNRPIPDAIIRAYPHVDGSTDYNDCKGSNETRANGSFHLNLDPGTYVFRVWRNGVVVSDDIVTVEAPA